MGTIWMCRRRSASNTTLSFTTKTRICRKTKRNEDRSYCKRRKPHRGRGKSTGEVLLQPLEEIQQSVNTVCSYPWDNRKVTHFGGSRWLLRICHHRIGGVSE